MTALEGRVRQMRMIDMHAHLSYLEAYQGEQQKEDNREEELEIRRKSDILTCLSGGNPDEWRVLEPFRERKEVILSFGIHPWYADQYEASDYLQELKKCQIIGEIGMDSVWCRIPLQVQQKQLERQLEAAADLEKPVLLHTKGAERTVADLVKDFPGKVCVHWYSGEEKELEAFIESDCYFTLGPDTAILCQTGRTELSTDEQVRRKMLQEIPANRLFVETDGIGAVAWAMGKVQMDLKEIPSILQENLLCAAGWKGISVKEMEERMKENLLEFLKK